MAYTIIDHRNDVIKCSKLKWNHKPQASGFTAKIWTFYGVIFMEIVVDLFLTITFILSRKTKNKTTGTAWHVMSFPWSILSTNQRARIRSVIVKLKIYTMRWSLQSHNPWVHSYRVGVEEWQTTIPAFPTPSPLNCYVSSDWSWAKGS